MTTNIVPERIDFDCAWTYT